MIRPRQRMLLAGLVALAAAGVLVVAGQPRPARLAADFTIDYSAGLLVREGRFDAPYQQEELAITMRTVAPQAGIDPRLPYNKPLAAALPYALLSLLPIELAFRVWQGISVMLLCLAVAVLARTFPLGRQAFGIGIVATLAAAPAWATLSEGQATPLLLLGAALLLSAARSGSGWTAALAGGLLAVKPQYLPIYLTALLAAGGRRAVLASALGGGVILMSPLIGGWSGLLGMVHNALIANQAVDARLDESLIGVLAPFMPRALATLLAFTVYGGSLLGLCLIAWRRRLDVTTFALLAGMVAVLVSPHALPHDLVLLGLPAWLSFELARQKRLPDPAIGWILLDVALIVDLRGPGLRLGPLLMTAMLGWMLFEIRRRVQPQQHSQSIRLAG